jgi:putative phage-type endonuclease
MAITNREDWLRMRAANIGASEIGALMGVDPHKSRYALWMEKAGRADPPGDNPVLRAGRWMEAAAIEAIRETHPDWNILRASTYYWDDALRIGATPDAFAVRSGAPGVVQCKKVAASHFKQWMEPDGSITPPLRYQLQVIAEIVMTAAEWGCLAVLVDDGYGLDLHCIDVPVHAAAWQRVLDEAKAFWASIAADNPPTPDYDRDGALISAQYPTSNGAHVDLSHNNHLAILLEERRNLKDAIRAAREIGGIGESEKRIASIDAEIRHIMGATESAVCGSWRLIYAERKPYTVKATRILRINGGGLHEHDE